MKILHMLQSDSFSGAENVVCQIISMCGCDAKFAYASKDGQIRDALSERNIEFYPLKKISIMEYRRVIKKVKPDIIHAHDMGASFFAALSCGKIPLVSHIHNNNFDSRRLSLKAILYYVAAKKAKHIFWVSKSAFEGYSFGKFFAKKSTVLYNIINIEMLKQKMSLDVNSYDYDVVFLGRLAYPKNPERVLRVVSKILLKRVDAKVAIIGIGDLEAEIKQMARENGLDRNVTFLGFRNNPTKILHDAKVMIMTSRWEGTPMCALEAMALGVPIVSTPTDGLCELVVNGETGYLSDDDDELALRICNIITDEELHQKLSYASEIRACEMMDIKKYREQILESYKKCLA